jgi:hypothetical protein
LLEATEEIAELRQKYKLLSQQLCQLKEEIQTKEKVHQNEDKKKTNFKKEHAIL